MARREGKDSVWTFPSYSETVLATKRHEPWSQAYSVAAINSELQRSYAYSDTIAGRIKSVILGGTDSSVMRAFRYSPQGDMSWLKDLVVGLDCSLPPSGVEVDGYTCSPSSTPTRTLGLEYDAARNLRKQVDSISMATDTAVVTSGNRLTNWGAKSYTYDADGNMITRTIGGTATTFSYDGEGMLRRTIVGSDTTCYEYNAFNQLVFSGTGCARNYTPGISARNANRIYVWDRDQIIAEVDSFASTRFAEYVYRPGTDRPHALLTDSAGSTLARFFHQDMLGNVIGVTHGTALAQSLEYDPWGELTASTGTLADTSRLRWKGLYWEGGNTKLYHVRNRWYDPEARRFTSEDPIGIEGGMNFYTFANNDWVNGVDPSGLRQECYTYWTPGVTVSYPLGGTVQYPGKMERRCTDVPDDWTGGNIPIPVDPFDEATGPGLGGSGAPTRNSSGVIIPRACTQETLALAVTIAGDLSFFLGVGAAARWAFVGARQMQAARWYLSTARYARTNRGAVSALRGRTSQALAKLTAAQTVAGYYSLEGIMQSELYDGPISVMGLVPGLATLEAIQERRAACRG